MSDTDLDAELTADDPTEGQDPPEPKDPPDSGDGEGETSPGEGEEKPEPMMPVAAHVAERKELQKRVDFAEDVARHSRNVQPPAEVPVVDPVDFLAEPEKIGALIDQKVKQATEGLSRSYAVRQHGRETVEKAYADLRDHGTPAEQQAISASPDPWGDTVERHQKRQVMAEIGDDPVAWKAAETERIKKELLAQAAVKQAKGITPPASLADEPNVGSRADTTEPDDSLEALIGR